MNNTTELTEIRILGKLLRNPAKSMSMNALAKVAGLSYVTVFNSISRMKKKQLINAEKKGKATLVSADLENAAIAKLSQAMIYERESFLTKEPAVKIIFSDIDHNLKERFFMAILFGSYAAEKQKDDSDIDMLFIVHDIKEINYFKEKIAKALRLHPNKKIDFNVVSISDFIEMLNQKYSVAREALNCSVVLFGAEQYYSLVKEYVRSKGY